MGNMTASTQAETHRITESTGTEAGILEMQEKGKIGKCLEELELARGIEPPTCGLQNRCSTD